MSRGWVVVLVLALILGAMWVVQWAFFEPGLLPFVLLGSSSLATGAIALWAFLAGRRRDAAERELEAVPDASHATVLLGLTVLLGVLAPVLGAWVAFTAAGTGVLAIGGLIRERRSERRALRAAREGATENA
ncbi:MAG TPA: hypothetical protein VGV40_13410 [Solirubrobacteraceae bacterium]|nr:hypothetical protein [Solirubrobacteraceae bacterium]